MIDLQIISVNIEGGKKKKAILMDDLHMFLKSLDPRVRDANSRLADQIRKLAKEDTNGSS